MLRLVAYDIADKKRLRRVAKVCDRFGVRVEKSVFECKLNDEEFRDFWSELGKELNRDEDALVCYPLCRTCESNILLAGAAVRPSRPPIIVT